MNFLLKASLIRRLSLLFVVLALIPGLLCIAAPTVYALLSQSAWLEEVLLVLWAAQNVAFLIIIALGAAVTLQWLALPIQQLIRGAQTIARGELSYRVPIHQGDTELAELAQTFNTMADSVETMRDRIESQRAALETALAEREREFDVILEIQRLVNKQADLPSTVGQALAITHSVMTTDIISLTLLDDRGRYALMNFSCKHRKHIGSATIEGVGDCSCEPLLRQVMALMRDNLVERAIQTRDVVRVMDTHTAPADLLPPAVRAALDQLNIRRLSIKPLVTDHVLGIITLMRTSLDTVPERAITLMSTLSQTIIILIENWHLKNKVRTLSIMEERRKLARDLHDSVTQTLFSLSLTAQGLRASLDQDSNSDQRGIDMLVEQTKAAQAEMRTLINEMRPIDLDSDDLESALRLHIQSFRSAADAEVSLTIRGVVNTIPKAIQAHVNRIAQEALSNVARHAQAKHVAVMLEIEDDLVTFSICDDGVGFDPYEVAMRASGSLGLISMRERAEMLGGALLVRSVPHKETSITAQIPLQHSLGERQ